MMEWVNTLSSPIPHFSLSPPPCPLVLANWRKLKTSVLQELRNIFIIILFHISIIISKANLIKATYAFVLLPIINNFMQNNGITKSPSGAFSIRGAVASGDNSNSNQNNNSNKNADFSNYRYNGSDSNKSQYFKDKRSQPDSNSGIIIAIFILCWLIPIVDIS